MMPSPSMITSALISSAISPTARIARNVWPSASATYRARRVGVQQGMNALADRSEDLARVERRRDLLADLGEDRHLVAATMGLLEEAGVLDRDADVRRDRRQETDVGFAEAALLRSCSGR